MIDKKKVVQQEIEKNETVIFAGSFNPPHHGHLAMLVYLAERFGQVIAVVGVNKNKTYNVSPEFRARLITKMIKETHSISNRLKSKIQVEVVSGYIWRFGFKQRASSFFRGIRSWEKDGKDEQHLLGLNTWGPIVYGPMKWPLPTTFLEGDPRYNHVSSTLIRDLCKGGKKRDDEYDLSTLIPKCIVEEVVKSYF